VCGGGQKYCDGEEEDESLATGRRLQEDFAATAGAATATVVPEGESKVDITYRNVSPPKFSRVGLGESPGIPNLEYLG
jgi:hypothetical protein